MPKNASRSGRVNKFPVTAKPPPLPVTAKAEGLWQSKTAALDCFTAFAMTKGDIRKDTNVDLTTA